MRTIRRLNSHRDLCDQFAKVPHPHTGTSIFSTYRELACFAALLGFEQNRRRDLVGATEVFVDGRIFAGSDQALDIAYLLALATTRNQDILREDEVHQEQLAVLFEEYAAGGLDLLGEWLRAEPSDPHGDRALLTGLRKGCYLDDQVAAETALDRVIF